MKADTHTRPPTETRSDQRDTEAGGEPDGAAVVEEIPLDVTFEILKNERRRLVLEYAREAEETVTIGELAEHIAAIENDTTVQQLNAQQRKRVYIGLYQCHLPKMDDAGVLSFNQNRGLVDLEPAARRLYAYLDVERSDDTESPPSRWYSGLVVSSGALFVLAEAVNAPFVASVVIFAFLVCVVVVSASPFVAH